MVEAKKGINSGKTKEEVNKIVESNPFLTKWKKSLKDPDIFEGILFREKNEHKHIELIKIDSLETIQKRASTVFDKIIKDNTKTDNILIVTHGSFITATIRGLFNILQVPYNLIGQTNSI